MVDARTLASSGPPPRTVPIPAQRTNPSALGTTAAIARHLGWLPLPLPVTLLRENDRHALETRMAALTIEPEGERPAALVVTLAGAGLDAAWRGAPCFVGYVLSGRPFSFRTVVRVIDGRTVRLDPPFEIRRVGIPRDDARRLAVEVDEDLDSPFVRLVVSARPPAPAEGAGSPPSMDDLHRRHGGRPINHPGQIEWVLHRLAGQERLSLSVPGDQEVYAVTMEVDPSRGPGTDLTVRVLFVNRRPAALPTGRSGARPVHLAGVVEGSLYTAPLPVHDVFPGRTGFRALRPAVIYRFTQRALPRFRVRHPGLRAVVLDADGTEWEALRLSDLSLGGAGVVAQPETTVAVGDPVSLGLRLHGRLVRLPGRCISASAGDGGVRLGIQFADLTAAQLRLIDRLLQRVGQLLDEE